MKFFMYVQTDEISSLPKAYRGFQPLPGSGIHPSPAAFQIFHPVTVEKLQKTHLLRKPAVSGTLPHPKPGCPSGILLCHTCRAALRQKSLLSGLLPQIQNFPLFSGSRHKDPAAFGHLFPVLPHKYRAGRMRIFRLRKILVEGLPPDQLRRKHQHKIPGKGNPLLFLRILPLCRDRLCKRGEDLSRLLFVTGQKPLSCILCPYVRHPPENFCKPVIHMPLFLVEAGDFHLRITVAGRNLQKQRMEHFAGSLSVRAGNDAQLPGFIKVDSHRNLPEQEILLSQLPGPCRMLTFHNIFSILGKPYLHLKGDVPGAQREKQKVLLAIIPVPQNLGRLPRPVLLFPHESGNPGIFLHEDTSVFLLTVNEVLLRFPQIFSVLTLLFPSLLPPPAFSIAISRYAPEKSEQGAASAHGDRQIIKASAPVSHIAAAKLGHKEHGKHHGNGRPQRQ